MFFLDLSNCGPSGILKVFYFIKLILNIVSVIIPIALIIFLSIDFSKAVISGDPDTQAKTFKRVTNRIMSAVFVFFVPTIVSIVNMVLGDLSVNYVSCFNNLSLSAINELANDELEEEKAARAARLSYKQKEKNDISLLHSDGVTIANGSGCDGVIYYEDGIFYTPLNYTNGTPETKGSAPYGYNKYFYKMLSAMIEDAKKAGYSISMSTSDEGAWRSYEKQQYFWHCYQTKSCNNGNLAAEPGTSNHGFGIASDLDYGSDEAEKWAHNNAKKYALDFTVCESYPNKCSEPWHIAPAVVKKGLSEEKKCK